MNIAGNLRRHWSGVLLGVLALSSMPAPGADPLQRFVVAPQAVNSTLGFENIEQRHPVRMVDGEQVDLQPLFAWINRGRLNHGKKPFDQTCPLPKWRPIDGTVIKVMDDAVLVAKGISRSPVIVKNYPATPRPKEGATVSVVAIEAGSFDASGKDGLKDIIPIFDYGIPVAAAARAVTNTVTQSTGTSRQPPTRIGPAPKITKPRKR